MHRIGNCFDQSPLFSGYQYREFHYQRQNTLRVLVSDSLLTISQVKAMGNRDTMIGADAQALGAVLVTNDAAFARIVGLKVVDWTKA
jgi:hypothetical protein